MKNVDYHNLDPIQKALLLAAAEVMEKAYNPYSKFFVGAALRTKNGGVITGANVENAAYGSCICAERSALVSANSFGQREFTAIAIIARHEIGGTKQVTAPCGSCRQMLLEASHVSSFDIEVIMATTDMKKIIISTIGELLPLGFGPNYLK